MMRRAPLQFLLISFLATTFGCTSALMRPEVDKTQVTLDELADEEVSLVSKYTHPYGLNYVKVESIALVTGLNGTGGDPPPTPQRAELLDEMKREGVPSPEEVLASKNTALVLLRGLLRPGIQEGDRFDIQVRVPSRSETTSLRGAWVLPSRMTELAILGQRIRSGHIMAVCEGPVLVDPSAESKNDEGLATNGRILGGGVATKSRPMGLVISSEHKSVRLAQEIAKEINLRFHSYDGGKKSGVAKAKTDEFVELQLHHRYKENVGRFVRVIRSLPIGEDSTQKQERLGRLKLQLEDPLTAAKASVRLEAIGDKQAIGILTEGSKSTDPEVRFYSAEALAYLDNTAAVAPLAEAVRSEPAFRANALAALSVMNDVVAYDALRSLLGAKSAETRYGAFRALWSNNNRDPLVAGERLGDQFGFHVLDVPGPPMVHVTRSYRPEIVLFGGDQQFGLPLVLDAGSKILVNGLSGSEVTVSRFATGEPAQKRIVSPRVDDVVRAIVELGGGYSDVVQALQQAKQDGALVTRFEVDALPSSGREYRRDNDDEEINLEEAGAAPYQVATPLPDLFSRKK